ncbi:Fatty acid resistance protein FarB [Methylobacterium isbiliense]|uniref:Fatty acid resistance protein FarB n=3 Tax=Methylobacterium isbiliense TaxID=315478 RepID=A0ABQ4S879_9HYPH|nr:Fatty acid resistance protein FarB [Methylobacterium isbiliense]
MIDLTNLYGDLNFGFFVWSRIYIGIGLPMIFLSITAASYEGIPKEQTDQASALINVARNVGGSMGVSLAQNVLAYRQQFHQSRLVEHVVPSGPAYQQTLRAATEYFATHGASTADARKQAIAWIGQQVLTQASFLAYVDVFWTLALVSASAVPLAMILKPVRRGGDRPPEY